jgi:hypothetical protein
VWEFIEVIRSPPTAHSGTEILPAEIADPGWGHHIDRDAHDLGRLFWREFDPKTNDICELVTIDSFYYRSPGRYRHTDLVGLRFRYTRGVEREVGHCKIHQNIAVESVDMESDKIAYLERRAHDQSEWYDEDELYDDEVVEEDEEYEEKDEENEEEEEEEEEEKDNDKSGCRHEDYDQKDQREVSVRDRWHCSSVVVSALFH